MNFLKIGVVFCFAALFVYGCSRAENLEKPAENNISVSQNAPSSAGANVQPPIDELASAQKIYSEACVKCHKADGAGGVIVIDGKNIKAPNLTSERQKRAPDSDYIETIENGALDDGMPAFKGKISDADIKNLVSYIRREFQGK